MSDQSCSLPPRGEGGLETVALNPEKSVAGYQEALTLAKAEATKRFEEYMLISWYDRDRDIRSSWVVIRYPGDCEKNGYILYAMNHGARLKVDLEGGRFVFFFTPVEWE